MIVKSVELKPESLDGVGLREVKMEGLGRFVVLTGKNGSGKTRVLDAVEQKLKGYAGNAPRIDDVTNELGKLRDELSATFDQSKRQQLAEAVSTKKRELATWSEIVVDSLPWPSWVRFVATRQELTSPQDQPPSFAATMMANQRSQKLISSSFALVTVHTVYTRYFRATHPDVRENAVEREAATTDWNKLKEVIDKLLGGAPSIDPETHELQLFGRTVKTGELSPGQNILLQLAIALHTHSASLDNTVLFMDEPENHLHPSAVIDVLDRLKNASDRMQFWIATHSVPLLAYLHEQDPKCIWYVADGVVQHAGKSQQAVLESLLGNSERLEQLRTFVALPEQVAIEQFAAECLLPPGVSDKGKGDPQVQQITDVIEKLAAKREKPLEVLDYGAGRGRLLAGMQADNADLVTRISYRALDEYPAEKEDCQRVIESVYISSDGRYFSDVYKLHDALVPPFDLLVLCNVLHEMTPKDWKRCFGSVDHFAKLLAPDGFLLVVEDQEIHVGEHAHEYGFLLLDTAELKELFAVTQQDIEAGQFTVSKHPERGDRLKAHAIAQPLIKRVKDATIKQALSRLQRRSRETIDKLRKTPASEPDAKRRGQAHARAAMLFANASLALEELGAA